MPIQIDEDSAFVTVRAWGTLATQDYATFVPEFQRVAASRPTLRILCDITALEGWEPSALWQEIKFDVKHFGEIQRLAVVGNREWQHAATSIAAVFASPETRYFTPVEETQARHWLAQP